MRTLHALFVAALLCAAPMLVTPAHAVAPVPVPFGTTWDAPTQTLQNIVDNYLGVPGAINVQTDFVGAHAGDVDPWFWVGNSFPALLVSEVAGNAGTNTLGWYRETGAKPVIDGFDDGIVFTGTQSASASSIIVFPSTMTRFGFYLDPKPGLRTPHQLFFTNRFFNDLGPNGTGAIHAPFDGDVQAIVFDVSQWKGPNTWLVCFEDLDAGLPIAAKCCTGTDDDYNDMVFEVTALGATPASTLSFGQLKARFGSR